MDDVALFHRIWLEFRVRRSKELQQELRHRTNGRTFGARMRTLRMFLGLTQTQLASALGVSVRTVIRYEREQSHRPWIRLWVGLRELETTYAEEIVSYLEMSESNPVLFRGMETRFR